MADASYFRDKQKAMRLAKDRVLTLALEYFARAVAIEAQAFGKDPDEDR
jgi:hypothetical protein